MNNKQGIIYAVSNRSLWLPEREEDEELLPIIKIGHTTPATSLALKKRMGQLFNTNIVLPFDLEYAKTVEDCQKAEFKLHRIFAKDRINPNREFFRIAVESIIEVLDFYTGKEITLNGDELSDKITQQDIDARNKETEHSTYRGRFLFDKLGIPVGAELVSIYDADRIIKVVDSKNVNLDGEIMSIHAATKLVNFQATGRKTLVSGATRWKYKGRTLHLMQKDLDNR